VLFHRAGVLKRDNTGRATKLVFQWALTVAGERGRSPAPSPRIWTHHQCITYELLFTHPLLAMFLSTGIRYLAVRSPLESTLPMAIACACYKFRFACVCVLCAARRDRVAPFGMTPWSHLSTWPPHKMLNDIDDEYALHS